MPTVIPIDLGGAVLIRPAEGVMGVSAWKGMVEAFLMSPLPGLGMRFPRGATRGNTHDAFRNVIQRGVAWIRQQRKAVVGTEFGDVIGEEGRTGGFPLTARVLQRDQVLEIRASAARMRELEEGVRGCEIHPKMPLERQGCRLCNEEKQNRISEAAIDDPTVTEVVLFPERPLLRAPRNMKEPVFEYVRKYSAQHKQVYWWCRDQRMTSLWVRPDVEERRIQDDSGTDGRPYTWEEFQLSLIHI